MELNRLSEKTRDLLSASYAIPDLETAVKQVIYNSIDAHAKTIKLYMDVTTASFTAIDDGDGIEPDDLYALGECYASTRVSQMTSACHEKKPRQYYGCRGAYLRDLTALSAEVEIESRVKNHWTSYRKLFKEGIVVFNARSQQLREAPGTKVVVSNLFWKLSVRRKDLSRNKKYQARVIQSIHSFCVSMSMIWPSLSFDIRHEGEGIRPVTIPAVNSCRERFMKHFGRLLGNELQYVDYASKVFSFSIRGYIAFVPGESGAFGQGIKQAKSYYQFTYFENKSVKECHRLCSRVITEAALQIFEAIPIFVLKVAALRGNYDISRVENDENILFKSPEQFHEFLYEFIGNFTTVDLDHTSTQACEFDVEALDCNEKHVAIFDRVEEAIPGYFRRSDTSVSTAQAWSNEVIPTPPSPEKMQSFLDSSFNYKANQWTSASDENILFADQCCVEDCSVKASVRCHTCGQRSITDDPKKPTETHVTATDSYDLKVTGFETANLALHRQAHEDVVFESEQSLKDIFFAHKPYSSLIKPQASADIKQCRKRPWLSSKPDAFDCADDLLELCQDHYSNGIIYDRENDENLSGDEQGTGMLVADDERLCREFNTRPSLESPSPSKESDYFKIKRQANSFVKHWIGSRAVSVTPFAEALRIENVVVFKGNHTIKICKSTLETFQVIRQVDRKFILVDAETQRGRLVLCIDQHAADERIRLETLEKEIFGGDGSLRRVETEDHEPPLVVRVNFIEQQVLCYQEDLIKSWGFEFEVIASKTEPFFNLRSVVDEMVRVLLYKTPKVERRVANTDDFREFLQLLSSASETYRHSRIRPPVITRLLHSRACRSAIMFGDHLSLGQCRDLIEDLKTCQLPFQCAHGRPSIVPLVEIHYDVT